MKSITVNKFFKNTNFIFVYFFLNQCGLYRKTDAREIATNAGDRVQKNMEEGRRIKFGNLAVWLRKI